MSLAKLVRPTIKAVFEYPAMPGFEVELTYSGVSNSEAKHTNIKSTHSFFN